MVCSQNKVCQCVAREFGEIAGEVIIIIICGQHKYKGRRCWIIGSRNRICERQGIWGNQPSTGTSRLLVACSSFDARYTIRRCRTTSDVQPAQVQNSIRANYICGEHARVTCSGQRGAGAHNLRQCSRTLQYSRLYNTLNLKEYSAPAICSGQGVAKAFPGGQGSDQRHMLPVGPSAAWWWPCRGETTLEK